MKKKYSILHDLERKDKLAFVCIVSLIIIIWGAQFNFIAVKNNGGQMPVYKPGVELCGNWVAFYDFDEVNSPYLTDIIKVSGLRLSIGDIFLFVGVTLYLVSFISWSKEIKKQMRRKNAHRNK